MGGWLTSQCNAALTRAVDWQVVIPLAQSHMIKLEVGTGNTCELQQQLTSPSAYLDHWAFRKISQNPELSREFVRSLKSKNGTLCLSWLNFVEFAKVDLLQKKRGEEFINGMLPNIAFLEVAPFVVIDREDALIAGTSDDPPHLDLEYGKVLLIGATDGMDMLSANRLLEYAASSELAEDCESFTRMMIDRVEQLRQAAADDPEFAKQIRNYVHRDTKQSGTRQLVREMMRSLLKNPKTKMTANHALDLTHTIVPVCYCDFVLRDAHWATQVQHARLRMLKDGVLKFPLAKVYSEKDNGIDRFLTDLAGFIK